MHSYWGPYSNRFEDFKRVPRNYWYQEREKWWLHRRAETSFVLYYTNTYILDTLHIITSRQAHSQQPLSWEALCADLRPTSYIRAEIRPASYTYVIHFERYCFRIWKTIRTITILGRRAKTSLLGFYLQTGRMLFVYTYFASPLGPHAVATYMSVRNNLKTAASAPTYEI